MLDGSARAVALYTAHIGGGHLAAEYRIFREVFEIAAAERIAMEVHARGKEYVHPIFQNLIAQIGGHPFHQVRVPRAGQQRADRKTGRHRLPRVTLVIEAHACGTVGEYCLGNAQTGDGAGASGKAGDQVVGRSPYQQRGLFFQGHGRDNLVNVVHSQLRLCSGGKTR